MFDEPNCSTSSLAQAALIIGYGVEDSNGKPYWLVKNRYSCSSSDIHMCLLTF